jgi:pimeloyl-ACP methyl ester carboxylesterase
MPSFLHEGIKFYYEVFGKGRPFLFSHGLGGNLERVREFVAGLPGLQIILYENRAHGRTRPVGELDCLTFARMADDMAALLDYVSIKEAFVGGVSMGAGIAVSFGLRHGPRVRALVLNRPAWLDTPNPPNLAFALILADLIERHGAERAMAVFEETDYYQNLKIVSPGTADSFRGVLDGAQGDALVAAYRAITASTPLRSMKQLSQLKMPSLVIGNHNDPIHPFSIAEAWARGLPASCFRVIPSRFDDPDQHLQQFRSTVAEFLRGIA